MVFDIQRHGSSPMLYTYGVIAIEGQDMRAYKGAILTCDEADSVHGYLVEDKGRIAYVGDEIPERYEGAELVDLGDGALIPCFVDTHEHFASFATFHAGLNVMDARSNEEISQMVSDFVKKTDAKMPIAFGASPYSVREGRLISREELDAVCPDKPMMMAKYDGHACIVNSKLLELIDDKVKDLRGYHPDTGEMNQEAFFAVSGYMTSTFSMPELIRNMQQAMDYLAEQGIGMVHTVSGIGFKGDMDITMEKWVGKSAQHGFQVRVFPQSMDINVALKRKLPRIGGCFACALDGCYGSHDAAMNEPYVDDGTSGVLYYTDEQVVDFCKKANRAGLQIEMHAIGDAAFDQATRALKEALDDYPRKDHRHGIIHVCLPTEEGLRICGDYGIQFPMQSAFINWPQEPDSYLTAIMGAERDARLNPLRTIWDRGIVISAGSDAPCTDPDPIMWMARACNHPTPGESLSIQEALRMCTYNGAWTTFDEKERGSLEWGKIADMTILSANPYAVPKEDLETIKVEQLLLAGRPYTPQCRGVVSTVLTGMTGSEKI